jgi:hypothetical protein
MRSSQLSQSTAVDTALPSLRWYWSFDSNDALQLNPHT